jgi:peptidoglycan hydrolase CwlO-like protein
MSKVMSAPQAASHFGVNIKTIRRWISNGKLSAEMVDGRWHVHIEGHDVPPKVQDNALHLQDQLKRADDEIKHLREQLSRRDEQIDHLTQVVAMSQKNVSMLTERMQIIEDLRHRKPLWERIFNRV